MKARGLAWFGLAVLTATAPATAADLPTKAPRPPAAFSWTGFYVGVNAGSAWGRTSNSVESGDPNSLVLATDPTRDLLGSFRQHGVIVGGQAGYNWQLGGSWIAGFETDIQAGRIKGSGLYAVPGESFAREHSLDWFGTIRGRLGFLATPNWLIYGTGGLAYGRTRASGLYTLGPFPGNADIEVTATGVILCAAPAFTVAVCYSGADARTSIGWTAGAGVEYAVSGNWSGKLEYLHVDLGRQTVTLSNPSIPGLFFGLGFRERVDIFRAGVNYRFGQSALVGRY
jgi:outer membrane immunogenic protein